MSISRILFPRIILLSGMSIIRRWLPPPESRALPEIRSDIDEEFAFHLHMAEQDLIAQGHDPAAAAQLAAKRFGNRQKWASDCESIATWEQRMIQRVNLILLVILVLLLGVVIFLTIRSTSQVRTAEALEKLQDQVAALSQAASQRAEDQTAKADRAAQDELPAQNIFLNTSIGRAGAYIIPKGTTLTLRRLLAAAGVSVEACVSATVRRHDGNTESLTPAQLADSTGPDITLVEGDLITVH